MQIKQAAGVTAIKNMKMDEIMKRVLDTILLKLRVKLIRLPIFGLLRIMNSKPRSSEYSL